MIKRKTSAYISLVICCFFAAVLAVWLFTFPAFFNWFYIIYHNISAESAAAHIAVRTVVPAFYVCAPFAGLALYLLIRLLLNIIKDNTFIMKNVKYLRYVSWCCYAVCLITLLSGIRYMPLVIIAAATGVVGTLLRVVKNLMQSAVELKEENELTI